MWQKCANSWTFSKVMAYLAKSWLDLTHSLLTHSVLKRILEERFNFLTFPADFYIPLIFSNLSYNHSNFLNLRNLQEQVKKVFCYLPDIILTFHCLNKLFKWSQKFWKFSAFSFEFQIFFSITRTIFSHSRSEQFW